MNSSPKVLLPVDSSRIQLQLSQKLFSNSTFDSLHKGSHLEKTIEKPDEMYTRRLKHHRHPLSGMKLLLPELSEQYASNTDLFTDTQKTQKLNSRVLETWINNTIADAASLNLPHQVIKEDSKQPLMRYGIDRTALLKLGLQPGDIDRLYRSLFVYSIGFYQLMQKVLERTNKKYSVITSIWKVYAILLEYCCHLDYDMIVTTLNIEKKEEINQLEAGFQMQISKLEQKEKEMQDNISFAKIQLQEVQKELKNEVAKREEIEDELLRRGSGFEEEVTMRLLFESKLNQMYAKLRDLQTKLELLNETITDLQKESDIRGEKLQKEREKSTFLSRVRTEVEHEMKKTEERYKQAEAVNISLDNRLNDLNEHMAVLNINKSNLNIEHSETLNELAQKKIEIDELKFALEVSLARAIKVESVIAEYNLERELHEQRIKYLEATIEEEAKENNFYKQEYVRIIESDKVNSIEAVKYKERFTVIEKELTEVIIEKNTLAVNLESVTSVANELRVIVEDVQHKLEEMNKARRSLDERLDFQKKRNDEKDKEIRENNLQIKKLKDEQDRLKTRENELESEISELRLKVQSSQKQFETTKETLKEKISNLYEILESEKKIRETWIYRYEDEQRNHSNATTQLILIHDKLNEATIKINHLSLALEECNLQKNKLEESHKEDLEEILNLRFENEETVRKSRTLQLVIESIDKEYFIRVEEMTKEYENMKDQMNQEINRACMTTEEIWYQALIHMEKSKTLEYARKLQVQKTVGVEKIVAEIREKLEKKTIAWNQKCMLLEEARDCIILLNGIIVGLKTDIKTLEIKVKKGKKELEDFRQLAPAEIRYFENPFEILTNRISELSGKIEFIENFKIETNDKNYQWDAPLPEMIDRDVMTDPVVFERSHPESRNPSLNADNFESKPQSINDEINELLVPKSRSSNKSKKSRNSSLMSQSSRLNLSIHMKHSSDFELGIDNLDLNDEGIYSKLDRATPFDQKSAFGKNVFTPEPTSKSMKSPNKLPFIGNKNRNLQASPHIYTPSPVPVLPSNDFKRAFKQAVSRRRQE
ncbi:hypothetical protein SteCoe_22076 [Stentor coeruleus]|uniref:Uncharacterized protein n=1 Tax=Stentor coeruleus TaxID=5963 RepID=A0A1R2BMZ1_9CILI|nr:hypothetical protein SteCoe_22076 [Stentor coeruleus]